MKLQLARLSQRQRKEDNFLKQVKISAIAVCIWLLIYIIRPSLIYEIYAIIALLWSRQVVPPELLAATVTSLNVVFFLGLIIVGLWAMYEWKKFVQQDGFKKTQMSELLLVPKTKQSLWYDLKYIFSIITYVLFYCRVGKDKIIDDPKLHHPVRRGVEFVLSLSLWALFIYFIQSLITAIFWGISLNLVYENAYSTTSFQATTSTYKYAAIFAIVCFLIIFAWAQYNYWRYGHLNRRKFRKLISDADMAIHFSMPIATLRKLKNTSKAFVMPNSTGLTYDTKKCEEFNDKGRGEKIAT